MQKLIAWFKQFNASTHALALGAIGLGAAYAGYPPFKALVLNAYNLLPNAVQTLIGTGAFIFALYKSGALQAKEKESNSGVTQKFGVVMLCVVLLTGFFSTGCSGVQVAQEIVNWTPALQSAVASVDATASILDPVAAPIFTAATIAFDAGSNLVVAQAKAYLANPSAGILAALQSQVVTFQQQVNTALLQAAKIVDPASQQKALADINGVGTIINTILSLVVSISGKAAVAQMAAQSTIKLARAEEYSDPRRSASILSEHYLESLTIAQAQVNQGTAALQGAGF